MAGDGQVNSLGRFLYTQNPFYLISCGLIIYGLQLARASYGDLFSQSVFLTAGLSGYTLLMAITAVGVIRLGKVWEDGRTILLVVVIGQFALSTGLDELCNLNWKQGGQLLAANAIFSVVITECVLRLCRMRLPGWYRISYYALLLVFYATPPLMGYAVAEHYQRLNSWGAMLFSVLVAISLLLLGPAMRQGRRLLRHNGTPWKWPLYPLSAFAIILVLAGLRTHAIWMSFGYVGAPARFEPFLLLPMAFAVLVLLSESERRLVYPIRSWMAMALAPLMMLCGVNRSGMTYLPIQSDLEVYFGSALSISLTAIVVFYFYLVVRRVPYAVPALTGSLLILSSLGQMPELAEIAGLRAWMIALVGSLIYFVDCFLHPRSDWNWLGLTMVVGLTILMAGYSYEQNRHAAIAAAVLATFSSLAIGACFKTELAVLLRHVAAVSLVSAAIAMVAWHILRSPGITPLAILGLISGITLLYLQIVKRLGWMYVLIIQAACLFGVIGFDGYQAGTFAGINLPIQSGILCFAIGVTISSIKTGMCWRARLRLPDFGHSDSYQPGL